RAMLLLRSVPSNFAANEPALSQPAAMASSGFKSITQKISRPPLSRVNIDASHEINGGEVSATTASWRRLTAKRNAQATEKLAKFNVLLQAFVFPRLIDCRRMILIPCQRSCAEKRNRGSS